MKQYLLSVSFDDRQQAERIAHVLVNTYRELCALEESATVGDFIDTLLLKTAQQERELERKKQVILHYLQPELYPLFEVIHADDDSVEQKYSTLHEGAYYGHVIRKLVLIEIGKLSNADACKHLQGMVQTRPKRGVRA